MALLEKLTKKAAQFVEKQKGVWDHPKWQAFLSDAEKVGVTMNEELQRYLGAVTETMKKVYEHTKESSSIVAGGTPDIDDLEESETGVAAQPVKKATVRKGTAGKAAKKKSTSKAAAPRKTAPKKPAAKAKSAKTSTVKKSTAKKSAAKKPAATSATKKKSTSKTAAPRKAAPKKPATKAKKAVTKTKK